MDNTNFILQVQTSYNQFTKAEKKVADYVIKNQKDVIYMSISDLANECKVGDTSVYRFCRTMRLQGYQEFKMKLSLSQGANTKTNSYEKEILSEDDSFAVMTERMMQGHLNAIKETFMLLNQVSFNKVLDMFIDAQRVFFFGVGDSLLTAEEARNKFLRVTNKSICITDPHMQAMSASTATQKDLIIIISYSGATKDNVHVAKAAKEAGAKVASITHFKKSPLTSYSDAILLCGSKEGPLEGGSMAAKFSQLCLIDLLYQEYYRKNYEECKINNETTSRSVVEKLF